MNKVKLCIILIIFISSRASAQQWTTSGSDIYNSNTGNVGIGVSAPQAKIRLDVRSIPSFDGSSAIAGYGYNGNGGIAVSATGYATTGTGACYGIFASSSSTRSAGTNIAGYFNATGAVNNYALITGNGNVGLGTATPAAKLDVNGNLFTSGAIAIGTKDVAKIGNNMLAVNGSAIFTKAKVAIYGGTWPDYVFRKSYQLPSLYEIERFIKLNGHLPEMPKAEDVEKNGLDLGETQVLLLKKIEELTLIAIEQNKQSERLLKLAEEQKKQLEKQQKLIEEQNQKISEQSHRIGKLEKKKDDLNFEINTCAIEGLSK